MLDYLVLARKYRPKTFQEIIGQDAIVTTLKNAIKNNRLAQAYLFSGMRGTGKTTLARVFAKALNCLHLSEEIEPCNRCAACTEILSGQSLDVLEIDGASNRGIEDVRRINETISYAAASGKYKIYIIDEVHMLTKEAFNALLKTLEEPPAKAKFFFATTEPQKLISTILSRCQRFELNRIPQKSIVAKLQAIALDLALHVEQEALELLAQISEGALRDAESLFDQVIAFSDGTISVQQVRTMLGIAPRDWFFKLDQAMELQELQVAFEIAEQVFSQGKDLTYFLEGLIQHIRNIIYIKVMGAQIQEESLPSGYLQLYLLAAEKYQLDQAISLLDVLLEMQQKFKFSANKQVALEAILLTIIRSKQRIPLEAIVQRLTALQKQLPQQMASMKETVLPQKQERSEPQMQKAPLPEVPKAPAAPPPSKEESSHASTDASMPAPPSSKAIDMQRQSKHDTLLHFAAVELEGRVQKGKKGS